MATGGLIGYYGLSGWWESALTLEERDYIESLFHPLGSVDGHPLTEGAPQCVVGTTAAATGLISSLFGWLKATPRDYLIRRKLREKMIELASTEPNVLATHFALQVLIAAFYRDREVDPDARPAAIAACQAQIALAPRAAVALRQEYPGRPLPRHVGYQQLAVILEQAGEYAQVVSLCREAATAEWAGDWVKRIARCQRRMASSPAGTTH